MILLLHTKLCCRCVCVTAVNYRKAAYFCCISVWSLAHLFRHTQKKLLVFQKLFYSHCVIKLSAGGVGEVAAYMHAQSFVCQISIR